ncbi:hypothetical protein SAMN02745136_03092 [Anaerocolumna jejuensis DSM 15929]|uniref:Uncharacterized protein n=1 Tax=Anaerocolumna jejuensis DSM 15929 TaxID=1121322 RepID=A0A1M6UHU6_9FIRM|nr:hypothetical protein SAMN02745136_03092 [Anaerocolumna jejuensis DSM 15929]
MGSTRQLRKYLGNFNKIIEEEVKALQVITFMLELQFVSSTDGRAYKCRKAIGEESPSFTGQSAG